MSALISGAPRPGLLASVADLAEMRLALAGGADIVDLKDPARGALGAWAPARLREAVALWQAEGGNARLSATAGDQPLDPVAMARAVRQVAETGVPIVKIGLPAARDAGEAAALEASIRALGAGAAGDALPPFHLIAVLFADQRPDFALLPMLWNAGFSGAMLDTADKAAGSLGAHLPHDELARFVESARALGLMTGLAGSLRLDDVASLAAIGPDYLGFRGALCAAGRTGALDPARLAAVRTALADAPPSDAAA